MIASVGVAAVQAVHNAGVLQMDGNAQTSVQSTPPASEDWDLICKANPVTVTRADGCTFVAGNSPAGTTTATSSSFVTDGVGGSIFTGGGSKDPSDLTQWKHKDGSVPDKDNLQHSFAARYTRAAGADCPATAPATTCDLLYFGADRLDNSGDAQQGFWFFQKKVVAAADGTFDNATGGPATHTNGDILIVSDFSNGGGTSIINVYKWQSGALVQIGAGANAVCTPLGPTDPFCGIVNGADGTVAPWTFTDKSGNHTYLQNEFSEFGLNLSDPSINLANECFSSFVAETRSSTSTTATLKDFVLGQLTPCGASITITPGSDTNEVNETHTLTVHVEKTVGSTSSPAAGVIATVTLSGLAVDNLVDHCDGSPATDVTDASGNCTVSYTSDIPGVVTAHAAADVVITGTTFHVETDGTGTNSGDAVKRFVDAQIDLSPLTANNEVGQEHIVTATVQKDDGLAANTGGGDAVTGFGPAAGATVNFSLLNNTNTTVFVPAAGDSCTTAANGTCSITIKATTAGHVNINATTTFDIGPAPIESVTRTTGTGGLNSTNADKSYVDAQIDLSPLTATNTVGDPHTIEAFVQQDDGQAAAVVGSDGVTGFAPAPAGTVVTFSLLNNSANAAFTTSAPFTCATIGTTGKCTITISSNTAGSVDIHATTTFSVRGVSLTRTTGTGGLNSADANKIYVAGSLTWNKVGLNGAALGGATFTVCKTQSYTLPAGPLVDIAVGPAQGCHDVSDDVDGVVGPGEDQDPAPGKFKLTGLALGTYKVTEKTAPDGWLLDPTPQSASLTPGDTDKALANDFVNTRPIVKISGFGYTNAPVGVLTHGVTTGHTVFNVELKNYGTGVATFSTSSLAVTASGIGAGTFVCNPVGGTQAIIGTLAAGATFTTSVACDYTNAADGAVVTGLLTVNDTTNNLPRPASGSPATITFTIQSE